MWLPTSNTLCTWLWLSVLLLSHVIASSSTQIHHKQQPHKSQQISLQKTTTAAPEPTDTPKPSTIVDILSSDVQYSYFFRHIQRLGLIPILNSLQNVTLLAPVNSAFASNSLSRLDSRDENQNPLLKYIVNQPFRVGYLGFSDVIFNTLYNETSQPYPLVVSPDFEAQEYVVDHVAAIVESDIYAKHQHSYIQAIDHLLPVKPSMCEFLLNTNDQYPVPHSISIFRMILRSLFTDFVASNKKKHKKSKHGFTVPQSCDSFFQDTQTVFIPSDAHFKQFMPPQLLQYYLTLHRLTEDDSIVMTKEAVKDLKYDAAQLLSNFMIKPLVAGVNGSSSSAGSRQKYHSVNKQVSYRTSVDQESNTIVLNGKLKAAGNFSSSYVLSNGAVHVFDTNDSDNNDVSFFKLVNIPFVSLTATKTLYSLHYSYFVRELKFRGLNYLIDGSTANQTIFLNKDQRDDVASDDSYFLQDKGNDFATASFSVKQSLLYQFVDSEIGFNLTQTDPKYRFHQLADSKMCSSKKLGSCYRLKLSASFNEEKNMTVATVNDENDVVLGPFIATNHTKLYITDSEVDTPSSFKHTLGTLISNGAFQRHLENIKIDKESCLTTLGYLNEFDLFSLKDNEKGYSVFLPCGYTLIKDKVPSISNDSATEDDLFITSPNNRGTWRSLGLVLKHLEAHPKLFKDLLKGFIIEDTIYSDFGLEDDVDTELITKNLRGDFINVSESYYDGDVDHSIQLNLTNLSIPLNSDILFNQGVVHVIDKVLIPENFEISLSDLIATTTDKSIPSQFSFLKLIEAYPKLEKALGLSKGHDSSASEFSLLVPTMESMKDFNITNGIDKILDFLEFHLIPNDQLHLLLGCVSPESFSDSTPLNSTTKDASVYFKTNLTNTELSCTRSSANGQVYLKLSDFDGASISGYNKDHEVKVVSHGCTSLHRLGDPNKTCVFLIDKPLNLKWLQPKDNFPHIHLGFVSIGIGIILGLILFGIVMLGVLVYLGYNTSSQASDNKTSGTTGMPSGDRFYSNDLTHGRGGPSYMRVTSDEDEMGNHLDHGYETDDDMLLTERDQLLPSYNKRRATRIYGSTQNSRLNGAGGIGNVRDNISNARSGGRSGNVRNPLPSGTAPRSIRGNNTLRNNLNRDLNVPGGI